MKAAILDDKSWLIDSARFRSDLILNEEVLKLGSSERLRSAAILKIAPKTQVGFSAAILKTNKRSLF